MLLLQLHFNIYSVLNDKNKQFYLVWFVYVLWLVHTAVFDGFSHCNNKGSSKHLFFMVLLL